MNWFYEKNGIRHDNVSAEEMALRIRAGELTASTLVWQAGMTDWQPLFATSLASGLDECDIPPRLPAHRIPEDLAWVLAFAPVIGCFLEGITAGLTGMNEDQVYDAISSGHFWYIPLLFNVALGYADDARLRKAGVNTDLFGKMAWLVPVYLWKRAKELRLSPATFWVWTATFVLSLLI